MLKVVMSNVRGSPFHASIRTFQRIRKEEPKSRVEPTNLPPSPRCRDDCRARKVKETSWG